MLVLIKDNFHMIYIITEIFMTDCYLTLEINIFLLFVDRERIVELTSRAVIIECGLHYKFWPNTKVLPLN